MALSRKHDRMPTLLGRPGEPARAPAPPSYSPWAPLCGPRREPPPASARPAIATGEPVLVSSLFPLPPARAPLLVPSPPQSFPLFHLFSFPLIFQASPLAYLSAATLSAPISGSGPGGDPPMVLTLGVPVEVRRGGAFLPLLQNLIPVDSWSHPERLLFYAKQMKCYFLE